MRTLYWLPRLFALIGSALLVVAVWLYSRERGFAAGALRADGEVVALDFSRNSDGGGSYHPVIRFVTARGESIQYRSNTGCNPPCYDVGERVAVLYDPGQPTRARSATFFGQHLGSFIFGVLGLVFGAIGYIWLYVQRRRAALEEELRRFGRRIEARFSEVERRMNLQVNGVHPWRIVCQWQDPGSQEVHVYRSGNLWFDPSEFVKDTVPVFVDRNDPRKYVVDVSFLPKAHL